MRFNQAPRSYNYSPRARAAAVLLAGAAFLGMGCSGSSEKKTSASRCAPFDVIAQNRWSPVGTAVRKGPDKHTEQVGGVNGNETIKVSGWLDAAAPYPDNSAPWNSDVWFSLADGKGWVNFAAVRAEKTEFDPTGFADGGQPVTTTPECKITRP